MLYKTLRPRNRDCIALKHQDGQTSETNIICDHAAALVFDAGLAWVLLRLYNARRLLREPRADEPYFP